MGVGLAPQGQLGVEQRHIKGTLRTDTGPPRHGTQAQRYMRLTSPRSPFPASRPRTCERSLMLGHSMGDPQEEPRQPSTPSWGWQVLTLPGHHPLGVPLGQHSRVPVEAGLLHLQERETTVRQHMPVSWAQNCGLRLSTSLGAEGLGLTTLQGVAGTAPPPIRAPRASTCPPGPAGALTSSGQ